MIKSFADDATRRVFRQETYRRIPEDIQRVAHRKLLQIHAATRLETLLVPPGNRLEKLSGTRKDQHSIRINRQWRICFLWKAGDAYDVEIADYH